MSSVSFSIRHDQDADSHSRTNDVGCRNFLEAPGLGVISGFTGNGCFPLTYHLVVELVATREKKNHQRDTRFPKGVFKGPTKVTSFSSLLGIVGFKPVKSMGYQHVALVYFNMPVFFGLYPKKKYSLVCKEKIISY
ncbi:hypothetical protein Ancab_030456 [Ancistrocladus abbreviatus]